MNRGVLFYLMPVLVIGASLLQSAGANQLEVRGVKPDLVLLLVIVGALVFGSRSSIGWAFLGGLALDLFSGGPLGSSSLALMAAALVVGIGRGALSRFNLLVPLAAVAIGTMVYGASYVGILVVLEALANWLAAQGIALNLVRSDLPAPLWSTLYWPTMQNIVVPAVFYNTALIVLFIPLLNRIPELDFE